MSTRRALTFSILLALGAALAGGIFLLFDLRFERGDTYPPYSTLRADPLGTRAFYESLHCLPGLTVSRNLRPLCELRETAAGTTLFYLGLDPKNFADFGEDEAHHLESFLLEGGRLVLSLKPQTVTPGAVFLAPGAAIGMTTKTQNVQTTGTLVAINGSGKSIRKAEAGEAERLKKEERENKQKPPAAPT